MGRCIVSGEGFYFFLSDNYHERFDTDQGINLEWPNYILIFYEKNAKINF